MKKLALFAILALFIFECKPKPAGPSAAETSKADTGRKNFFPVLDYLKSEIAYVDSMPFKIMKYSTVNGKMDSAQITDTIFHNLAQSFLPVGLDSISFENKFTESSFMDQTTGLLTFTYATTDTSNGLKRVDVLATPDLANDRVRSIYLESMGRDHEMAIIEKMYWKSRHEFTIIRIYNPVNQPSYSTQLKVVWDNVQ